jgi:dienelactone hydrolase
MSQLRISSGLRLLGMALLLSVTSAGCAIIPDSMEFGMPKMPKLFGGGDKEKEDVVEVEEDELDPEREPVQTRRRAPRQEPADTGPASISPYDEKISEDFEEERQPRSQVRMADPAPVTDAGSLSAEDIAQMATAPKSRRGRRATATINDVVETLDGTYRIYTPRGTAPFPTVMFFPDCSGSTKTHERAWAGFYTGQGYVMIAVDSIGSRGLDWEDVCGQTTLNPAERAADVFASLRFARSLAVVDGERMAVTGFSHGASTIWASLLLASGQTPPIGIRSYPADAIRGLKAAYMFYGPCLAPWTVDVAGFSFLGESDKYVNEQTCVKHARRISGTEVTFDYEIFKGATHAFDHPSPNASNKEGGAIFDKAATDRAREMIKDHLDQHVRR